ncbi:MAG TPA: hypothetical protein PKD72_04395, partial [Gemmatales bacterium]|nr:hypothetical protein [Gemmatales bacterium]
MLRKTTPLITGWSCITNSGYGGVWPATAGPAPASDAEARLTVRDSANNVQSVYRLIVTSHLNISNIRNPGQPVQSNMGYPNSLLPGSTGNGVPQNNTISVVYFNTNGTDERVLPSNGNYGPADPSASPLISDGFYLVGPVQQPVGTGSHMATPTDPNFPAMNFVSPQMQLPNRVQRRYGRYDQAIGFDPVNVREAVLLQRLANPYLPHNPLPNATIGTETSDPNLPYNPYITVDYVDNLMPARAVERDEGPSDPLQPGQPDQDPVTQRHSIGKMQPYAALNNVETNQTLWRISTPNRDNDATVPTPLNDQIQHTFFRHNGIEYVAPSLPYTPPTAVNANTIKYPFDWLTHLDREPTSAAELLHVSGFKPHELTQQFNQMTRPINGLDVGNTTLNATGATTTLSFGASSDPYPNRFNGSHLGVPWSVKAGDQLLVTFSIGGTPALPRWVRVTAVAPDYSSVTVVAGNMGATPVDATASVQVIVPFAHQAPWYRAEQNVDVQSSSRIYRLLEVVSTRNPGIDAGQMRFTSGVTGPGIINMNTANNVGEPDPVYNDGSRWIQLDNARIVVGSESFPGTHLSSTVQVTVNDALIRIPGSSAAGGTSLTTVPYNNFLAAPIDGEHLVARWIDTFSGNPVVQRVTILERDLPNNRIRVVLNNLPSAIATGGGTLPMTFDYAYIAGRALGKINLNTMFDLETWRALADAQPINSFWEAAPPADREAWVDRVFRRLYQQRQPGYFTRLQSQLPGHTGLNGVGEDRPFQGQAAGDIPFSGNIPLQGIGNTFLSDRYQESLSGPNLFGAGIRSGVNGDMFSPVPVVPTDIPGDNTEIRYLRTLFELGNPGEDHP